MPSPIVYIVMGRAAYYEDSAVWIVKAFQDEAMAQARCTQAFARFQELQAQYGYCANIPACANEYDLGMITDSGAIWYEVVATEYVR